MSKYYNYELAYLIYKFGGDREMALRVFSLYKGLSAHGFEMYVKTYVEKYLGHKVLIYNKKTAFRSDGGVDIMTKFLGKIVIIQCKRKKIDNLVTRKDLLDWFEKVNIRGQKLRFATLSHFTPEAIQFAKERGIKLFNYKNFGRIAKKFSLENFYKMYSHNTEYYEANYREFIFQDVTQLQLEISEDGLERILKNIRYDIMINKGCKNTGEVCSDTSIKILATNRPKNIYGMKRTFRTSRQVIDDGGLLKYYQNFLDAIKIVG